MLLAKLTREKDERHLRPMLVGKPQRRQSIKTRQAVIREDQIQFMTIGQGVEKFLPCADSLDVPAQPRRLQVRFGQLRVERAILEH